MKKFLIISVLLAGLSFIGGQTALADDAAVYKRHCAGCHGLNGEKNTAGATSFLGKSPEDIRKMLLGYKDGSFGGPQKSMMQKIVNKLSDSEMASVIQYAGSLK